MKTINEIVKNEVGQEYSALPKCPKCGKQAENTEGIGLYGTAYFKCSCGDTYEALRVDFWKCKSMNRVVLPDPSPPCQCPTCQADCGFKLWAGDCRSDCSPKYNCQRAMPVTETDRGAINEP